MIELSRRGMLAGGASLAFAGWARRSASSGGSVAGQVRGYGSLVPDPAGLFDLPEGFSYRILSTAGERMDDGLPTPGNMDGMGCFDAGGGRIALVRNHELKPRQTALGAFAEGPGEDGLAAYDRGPDARPLPGGTTTILFNPATGRVERQHLSLAGTAVNCAGGQTPWGSWLTCEEIVIDGARPHGYVFEVPSAGRGLADPVPLRALGRFKHEAAAIDPSTGIVYLTEDKEDGLFYRFLPDDRRRLGAGGRLQALAFADGARDTRNAAGNDPFAPRSWRSVRWIELDGTDADGDDLRLRGAVAGAARFARGEGIHFGRGELYFTCTSGGAANLGQIMRYIPGEERLQNFVESGSHDVLDYGDNLTVTPWNHLMVCEDQYTDVRDNKLKGITPDGATYTVGRVALADQPETAGVCFSPDGRTMFLNIYRPGHTLAITGPWQRFDDRPINA